MTEIDNQIKQINSSDDAVAQLMGEQFVQWAREFIESSIQSTMAQLNLPDPVKPEKLRKFLAQRVLGEQALTDSSEGDPGFLGFAIANLSESNNPEAESPLAILEQIQSQARLPNRWAELLKILPGSGDDLVHLKPKEAIRDFIADLSDGFSNSDWQSALGALVALEYSDLAEYRWFLDWASAAFEISAKDLSTLTSRALEEHYALELTHTWDKIVLDANDKGLLLAGIDRQLRTKRELFIHLAKYLN